MSEKLPGIVQIAFNKKQTRCLVVTASGPPGNNKASGQSKNITEKDSILPILRDGLLYIDFDVHIVHWLLQRHLDTLSEKGEWEAGGGCSDG